MRGTPKALALVVALSLSSVVGCGEPDNSLEGGLSSQYDLSFDEVRVRQLLRSGQLVVEYVRSRSGSEEKPLIATVRPLPGGPGSFTYPENVGLGASLMPGSPSLPEVQAAEVVLEAFSPDTEGSEVRGRIHAMFTNLGTGDSFPLEGRFKAELDVVN